MEAKPVEMDLRFAVIRISSGGIEFTGKRGSPLRVSGEQRELPPASGEFRVTADKFIELVGSALLAHRGESARTEPQTEPRADSGTPDEPATSAADSQGNVAEETTENSAEGTTENPAEKRGMAEDPVKMERSWFRRRLVGRPEGVTLRIEGGIFRRPAVRFSVVRRENGEIRERTAGLLIAEQALVLMDMAGLVLKRGRYMRPLSVAALFCGDGKVTLMSGNRETGLTEPQQRELKYVLSLRFIGDIRPIRFRVGRFSLREEDGRFFLRFGGLQHEITPGDLAVIRAILV